MKIPASLDIRPTQDRVKESIFSSIGGQIEEKNVLDLFAGSGSLGLEALSRGAGLVYFIDRSLQAIQLIKSNMHVLPIDSSQYTIIRADAVHFLKTCKGLCWDMIFLDPPYRIADRVMEKIFYILAQKKITHSKTLIIYQYFFKKRLDFATKKFNIVKESSFGDKKVSYLTP